MSVEFSCAYCGKLTSRPAGHVNRSHAQGLRLYCGRVCSGLGRRVERTLDEKRELKRLYDIEYREINRDRRRAQRAAYHKATYDPIAAAEKRKKRMPLHVEYCRRPEYRKWKSGYDKRYRALSLFGSYADCFLLLQDIENEIAARMTKYEIKLANGTINKAMKRRRDYENLIGGRPQNGAVGDPERHQE
jgi:hypothetical protein